MCSVQDGSEDVPTKRIDSSQHPRKCMKCDELAVVIIRINDAFCGTCFQTYCTHKFRSAFGKSKLIRDGEKVLVAFSGGHCSTAVLHLIQEGLSKRAQKKLRFQPHLVYINEGAVYNHSYAEQLSIDQGIIQALEASHLPYHVVDLETAFHKKLVGGDIPINQSRDDEGSQSQGHDPSNVTNQLPLDRLTMDDGDTEKLQRLLASCQSLTAKEDVLRRLRCQLLADIAVAQGYSKVLLGDSATRLSVRLLSDIAQGRGMHIPSDVGFSDTRHDGVMFVRPLRDFTIKEVAMYNQMNHLQAFVLPTLSTKLSSKASIDSATEAFVTGLQAQFPSTVSTICRTGEKLEGEFDSSVLRCVMCKGQLDTDVPASSALFATEFSQIVSKSTSNLRDDTNDSSSFPGENSSHNMTLSKAELKKGLCYGCRLVVRDMDSLEDFPTNFLEEASQQINRLKMKESINEFLLTDDTT